jgi:hypothetical protein
MVIGVHFGVDVDLATLYHKSERALKRRPVANRTMEPQRCRMVFIQRPCIVMPRPGVLNEQHSSGWPTKRVRLVVFRILHKGSARGSWAVIALVAVCSP